MTHRRLHLSDLVLLFIVALTCQVSSANAEMKVSFLAAVQRGSMLRCEAVVVSGGTRTAFVEASITNDEGRLVARASSTYLMRDRQ